MRYEFDRERLDELLDRWFYALAGRLIADVAQGETADEAVASAVQLFPGRLKSSVRRLFETIEEESGNYGRGVDNAVNIRIEGFHADRKIDVIRAVRAITGLGIKEAKEWVEGVPKTISVPDREAELVMKKLEESGAKVA